MRHILASNKTLERSERIYSPSKEFYLVLSEKNNLVLFKDENPPKPIWATETHSDEKHAHVQLTHYGDLVMFNPSLKGMNTNMKVLIGGFNGPRSQTKLVV